MDHRKIYQTERERKRGNGVREKKSKSRWKEVIMRNYWLDQIIDKRWKPFDAWLMGVDEGFDEFNKNDRAYMNKENLFDSRKEETNND